MNNHTRKTSSGEGKHSRLDLTGKKPKRWQPYQAYSHLYYDKLRPTINSGYLAYIRDVPEGEKVDSLFKYRNQTLRAMLEQESSAVKAEVEARCNRTMSTKEEAEIEALMNENVSEDDIKEALRKR